MTTVDLATLGLRIAQARARAGRSQASLAEAVALDRSALAKVEGGSRRLSALELARIADELDERIEWFLTEPPPSIVSHRNVQDPGSADTIIDRLVERIARHVEFVGRHDERFQLPGTPFGRATRAEPAVASPSVRGGRAPALPPGDHLRGARA